MSSPCIVIAIFEPLPGRVDEVKSLLAEVAPEVHHEEGCELYALHSEVNGKLVFIEKWTTRELWQIHNDAPSVQKITAGVAGLLERDVLVMEMYSDGVGEPVKAAL